MLTKINIFPSKILFKWGRGAVSMSVLDGSHNIYENTIFMCDYEKPEEE